MDARDLPAIEVLLPHRTPMRLVDDVLEIDENHIRTCSIVEETWPLCSGRGADTALYHQRKKRLGEPQIDFLVGIKDARFHGEILPLHGELTADVRIISTIGNYGIFHGNVKHGEDILCEAMVQGWEPDEELWEAITSGRRGVKAYG